MQQLNFMAIVQAAWQAYDPHKEIQQITDISVQVSTNHVYKIEFSRFDFIIAKLSYFGTHQHFAEDHQIINVLAQHLPKPYENVLARSLQKDEEVFVYRHQNGTEDIWVVFYHPVQIRESLPRRLDMKHIQQLGEEMAHFHLACEAQIPHLPASSKTLRYDIRELSDYLDTPEGRAEYGPYIGIIHEQTERFHENLNRFDYDRLPKVPVFIDWNIGNFSLNKEGKLFSRWDYDWFRCGARILDFYFLSRVVSDIGDKTVFHYLVDPLLEGRFLHFLTHYHKIYPLSEQEVYLLREVYRFFILNYVVKFGRHFFHSYYATRLQREAYEVYLPAVDQQFDPGKLLTILNR
ncbi:MAG: hypothetical protein AAF206_05490 [Bacteroidota bacterium]